MSATPNSSNRASHDGTETSRFRPRACVRCGQSKLKCTWPAGNPGTVPCERCARAKTECVLPSIKSTRPRRVNHTRVGKLEQKLDGIMSLLTASQQIQQSESSANGTRDTPQSPERSQANTSFEYAQSQLAPLPIQSLPPPSPSQLPLSGPNSQELIEIAPGIRITYDDADQALERYRITYYPLFPFVPIAENVTAYDLSQRKPLLFRTIVQVALVQSPEQQLRVKGWFREYIAQHVVVQEERELELLQAILIFLSWTDYGFYVDSRVTNLMQLASALVIDLGLNKPPSAFVLVPYSLVNEAAVLYKAKRKNTHHSLEDMRAVLGCFYFHSMVSSFFRRMHHFPFSTYLNHCCDALAEAKEHQSDSLLVALVQIQRLIARIHATIPNPEADLDLGTRGFYAPLQMTISTIRRELDAIVECSSPEVASSFTLQTAYHGALVRIYEPAIYMHPSLSSNDSMEAGRRTECLWNCLQANNRFVEAFLAIPSAYLGALPSTAIAHLSFCLVTSSRLLFLQDADWDVSVARRSLDFASITRRLEERFQAADFIEKNQSLPDHGRMGGRKKHTDSGNAQVFMSWEKMRWMRHWYLSKLPGVPGEAVAPTVPTASDSPSRTMDFDSGFGGPLGDPDTSLWDALMDSDGFGAYPLLGPSSLEYMSQAPANANFETESLATPQTGLVGAHGGG